MGFSWFTSRAHRASHHVTVALGYIHSDSLPHSTGAGCFTEKTTMVPEERKPTWTQPHTHVPMHTHTHSTHDQVFLKSLGAPRERIHSCGLFKDVRIIMFLLNHHICSPVRLIYVPRPPTQKDVPSFQVRSRRHCRHFSSCSLDP